MEKKLKAQSWKKKYIYLRKSSFTVSNRYDASSYAPVIIKQKWCIYEQYVFFSAHPCWTTALPLCLLFPRWSLTPRLLLTELPAEQTDKIGPGPAVGGTESGTQQLGEGPQKAAAGKKRKRKKTKEKDSVERFVRFSHLTDRFHCTAEFKDEFSRPDVAFCHRDRRKVTSAEICRAR